MAHLTLEQRCRLSEQCLPDAPYRAMLTKLHDEMLAALAHPAQEPVAVVVADYALHWVGSGPIAPLIEKHKIKVGDNLYTTTPHCKPLTEEQVDRCIEAADTRWADAFIPIQWARHFKNAIEAAHGIKENT